MDGKTLTMQHEGERLRAYKDTRGYITIGFGRNLEGRGISHEEALMLFTRDYSEARNEALTYPWFNSLGEPRQAVVIDMIFELGTGGFRLFVHLHQALAARNYKAAAAAMLNSAWDWEVPQRAHDNAAIMNIGAWPAS